MGILEIALYICKSLALMKMAERLKLPQRGVAFLPVGDLYLLGLIAEYYDDGKYKKRRPYGKMLLWGGVIVVAGAILLSTLIFIGKLLNLIDVTWAEAVIEFLGRGGIVLLLIYTCFPAIVCVLAYIALYRVYRMYMENHVVLMLVLSIILPMVIPVILLVYSQKEPLVYKTFDNRCTERD